MSNYSRCFSRKVACNFSILQTPANYQFAWEVKDDYTGNDFGQEEARSGYNTDGEYSVLLPDGRKQIVSYRVLDGESGFVADVRYEGDASYVPAPAPSYKPSPPAYKPAAPAYKPAPPPPAPKPYKPVVAPAPYRKPKAYPRQTTPAPVYTTAGPAYVPQRPRYDPRPAYRPNPTPAPAYKPVARTYGPRYTTPEPTTTTAAPTTVYSPPAPTRGYRRPSPVYRSVRPGCYPCYVLVHRD